MEILQKQASNFLQNKFNISPESSKLVLHEKKDWNQYCTNRELNLSSEGIYCVRDLSAHILKNSEFLVQNLFHELFGHGLYIEHTVKGKQIYSLEQKLCEKEKQCNISSLDELKIFRQNNQLYKQIMNLKTQDLEQCEGFAMWMEFYLSSLTNNLANFEKKSKKLSNNKKIILQKFIDYSQEYGEHALIFSCGLPKYYDNNILERILKNIFIQDFESVDLALVYGSREKYSDIDVFIVSDKIQPTNFGWLDIYSINRAHFEKLVSNLDISVTDALFSGDLILGDNNYLEKVRRQILGMPITADAIRFHKEHSKNARELALKCIRSPKHYRSAMQHHASYLANASDLEKGIKRLTFNNLKALYPEVFMKFDKKAYKNQKIKEA